MSEQPRPGPWDAGLQPERTSLAWTRTGLALLVVSLLVTRLAPGSGGVAIAAGLAGTVLAAVLMAVQPRRHQRQDARLRAGRGARPSAVAAIAVTGVTVLIAVTALVLVLAPAVTR